LATAVMSAAAEQMLSQIPYERCSGWIAAAPRRHCDDAYKADSDCSNNYDCNEYFHRCATVTPFDCSEKCATTTLGMLNLM
jgi:hypothetical protein